MAHDHPFADRWNHNTHHYPRMRSEIEGARRVLDVGCGDATFCRYVAEQALPEAVRVLGPGGRLVVLGYGRFGGPRDLPHELRDLLAHRVHSRGKDPWEPRTAQQPPSQTWADAARTFHTLLPGSTYRRLPLWRYLVTWRKPSGSVPA